MWLYWEYITKAVTGSLSGSYKGKSVGVLAGECTGYILLHCWDGGGCRQVIGVWDDGGESPIY